VEAKHGWSAKDYWMTDHHLLPFFLSPLLSTFLAQPPHPWDKVEEQWPHGSADRLSYPVPRNRERSLHTCAQDVQITRMATI
jgi:hypothetical protein